MGKNSMLAYKGELTFKILHGDKVVKTIKSHNSGTILLMQFLTHCLGSVYNDFDAPRYLRAFKTDSEGMATDHEITLRPVITNFSPSYNNDNENVKSSVVLTFLIPSSYVDINDNVINRFAIYNTKGKDAKDSYMAWVDVRNDQDEPTTISITSGESLMVLWEMTLQNVEVEE